MGIRAQGLDMGSGANLYGVVNALLSLAEENFYFILFYYLYATYYINYVENFIVVAEELFVYFCGCRRLRKLLSKNYYF